MTSPQEPLWTDKVPDVEKVLKADEQKKINAFHLVLFLLMASLTRIEGQEKKRKNCLVAATKESQ